MNHNDLIADFTTYLDEQKMQHIEKKGVMDLLKALSPSDLKDAIKRYKIRRLCLDLRQAGIMDKSRVINIVQERFPHKHKRSLYTYINQFLNNSNDFH